jgi:hypothetical protein
LEQGVRKFGGFGRVATALGIEQSSQRREAGYWRDLALVEAALREFMRDQDAAAATAAAAAAAAAAEPGADEGGVGAARKRPASLPTQKELRDAGRVDLAQAITEFHGGFAAVGERLGFRRRSSDWSEFYNLARELFRFCRDEMDNLPVMPTSTLLRRQKRSDLLAAISKHGGMASVAGRLGLQYMVRTRETFRDWTVFCRSLLAFTESHGVSGQLPSSRELRNFGRSELYQGILYWGGPRRVGERTGLVVSNYWQYFHYVGAQILDFIDKHGTPGLMPSEADFLDIGQVTLSVSTAKFGYSQVASRLGLRETGQSTQTAPDASAGRTLFYNENDARNDSRVDEAEDDAAARESALSTDDLDPPRPNRVTES